MPMPTNNLQLDAMHSKLLQMSYHEKVSKWHHSEE